MASLAEFPNMPGMTKEMQESMTATLDALTNWRDEIETVNERCLREVLDQASAVARAVGWPDQAVQATRQYMEKVSTAQIEVIEQMIESWKRQLESPTAPLAFPRSFTNPQQWGPTYTGATPEFDPLAPWTFWMKAAEAWQRAWMLDRRR